MMRLAECPANKTPALAAPALSGLRRAVALFLLAVFALGSPAHAGVSVATAMVTTTILDSSPSFQAMNAFTLPAIKAASGRGASMAAQTSSGDTELTISGRLGDTVSLLTPSSFTLVREGGNETVTATTRATSVDAIGGQDLMTGDGVMRADTMKVKIGLKLTQASGSPAPAGAYSGQFLVLIQYN